MWTIIQKLWIWITFSFCLFFKGLTAAAAAAAAATNAAIAEAMKVKKIKLEAMSNYHASNNQHGADSENGDMNSSVGKFYVHCHYSHSPFQRGIFYFRIKLLTTLWRTECFEIKRGAYF